MNGLIKELTPYIVSILGILLSYIGAKLSIFLNSKIDEQNQKKIEDIIKGSVLFVEQVTKQDVKATSKIKYEMAKDRALILLEKAGFVISKEELEMLIESFVINIKGEVYID